MRCWTTSGTVSPPGARVAEGGIAGVVVLQSGDRQRNVRMQSRAYAILGPVRNCIGTVCSGNLPWPK